MALWFVVSLVDAHKIGTEFSRFLAQTYLQERRFWINRDPEVFCVT